MEVSTESFWLGEWQLVPTDDDLSFKLKSFKGERTFKASDVNTRNDWIKCIGSYVDYCDDTTTFTEVFTEISDILDDEMDGIDFKFMELYDILNKSRAPLPNDASYANPVRLFAK